MTRRAVSSQKAAETKIISFQKQSRKYFQPFPVLGKQRYARQKAKILQCLNKVSQNAMQIMKIQKQKLKERQRAQLQTMQENLLSYRASILEEKGENPNKIHQLKLKVGKSHRSWQRRPGRMW